MKEVEKDLTTIAENVHFWNWAPDVLKALEVYQNIETSFSVLTPFIYACLEEIIRSTTSEYGRVLKKPDGAIKTRRQTGLNLINLAIRENKGEQNYVALLEQVRNTFYAASSEDDQGNNRNSVVHGYMHPRYWSHESFKDLVHFTSQICMYAKF